MYNFKDDCVFGSLDSIKVSGDLGHDYFSDLIGVEDYSRGVRFYIDGMLTGGVCLVNPESKTIVIERLTLSDGMKFKRFSFNSLYIYTLSKKDFEKGNEIDGVEVFVIEGN